MNKVALLKNTNKKRHSGIKFSEPYLPNWSDIEFHFRKIWSSGVLTKGSYVEEFERKSAEYLRVDDAVAVSSCTIGLFFAYYLLGSKYLTVPSFTWPSTITPLILQKIDFEYVDIVYSSLTVKNADISVHTFGIEAADGALIYDSAHRFAPPIRRDVITVYSLAPTKLVTSCEGGMVVGPRDVLRDIRKLRNYGEGLEGLNGRMSEIHAAIGLATLNHIDRHIGKRRQITNEYHKYLKSYSPYVGELPTYVYPIIAPGKTMNIKESLIQNEIEFKTYFEPCHYKYGSNIKLPITEMVAEDIICLPIHSGLNEENIKFISEVVLSAIL